MPNTHYRVKGEPPVVKEVVCELRMRPDGDLRFIVGNQIMGVLRPDGTYLQCILYPARAAELGLQLDETGRVKCVR